MLKIPRLTHLLIPFLFLSSCGGGGSSGGVETPSGGIEGAATWEANASVLSDTCGERISAVKQMFEISDSLVSTGIVTVPLVATGNGFNFGFAESNGNCNRNYLGEFQDVSGGSATVKFTAASNCDGKLCKSEWSGTASKIN